MMVLMKKKITKTVHSNVEYDGDKCIFIAGQQTYTAEFVQSRGWRYDSSQKKLIDVSYEDICGDCDSSLMYDTETEEYYCPKCSP